VRYTVAVSVSWGTARSPQKEKVSDRLFDRESFSAGDDLTAPAGGVIDNVVQHRPGRVAGEAGRSERQLRRCDRSG
jgi:hypothetical protein